MFLPFSPLSPWCIFDLSLKFSPFLLFPRGRHSLLAVSVGGPWSLLWRMLPGLRPLRCAHCLRLPPSNSSSRSSSAGTTSKRNNQEDPKNRHLLTHVPRGKAFSQHQNTKYKSLWHSKFCRFQLSCYACNPNPMPEGCVCPPGHALKILASSRKGRKDTVVGFCGPPPSTTLKPTSAIFFWSGGTFQDLLRSPPL